MSLIYHISLIFLILLVSSTTAQVNLGLFAGINSTNFSGDNPPNASFASDIGYDMGATADFYFFDDVALNIQPMYSHQSTIFQYEVKYQYEPYDSLSVKTNYFEIPIQVKIIANNKMTYAAAGLSFAIPLSANVTNSRTGSQEDITDRFEEYMIYANFGVGIQFSIGKPMLFVEFRYSQSLTNLTKLTIQEITLNNKLKSTSIQLQTGILFTL